MDMPNFPRFLEEELHVSINFKDVAHQNPALEDFDRCTNYAMDQIHSTILLSMRDDDRSPIKKLQSKANLILRLANIIDVSVVFGSVRYTVSQFNVM